MGSPSREFSGEWHLSNGVAKENDFVPTKWRIRGIFSLLFRCIGIRRCHCNNWFDWFEERLTSIVEDNRDQGDCKSGSYYHYENIGWWLSSWIRSIGGLKLSQQQQQQQLLLVVRYRTAVSYRKKRNGCVVRGDVWCDVEAISDMRSPKVHVRVAAIQFNCGYEEYSSAIFLISKTIFFESWAD